MYSRKAVTLTPRLGVAMAMNGLSRHFTISAFLALTGI